MHHVGCSQSIKAGSCLQSDIPSFRDANESRRVQFEGYIYLLAFSVFVKVREMKMRHYSGSGLLMKVWGGGCASGRCNPRR